MISNRRSAQTRREYQWEVAAQRAGLFSDASMRTRSLKQLKRFVAFVYAQEFPNRTVPALWWEERGSTACYGRSDIFIHRRHYCYAIVLHELVHASGFSWHTCGFVLRYIELLGRYAKCDDCALFISAGLFGVIK